MNHKQVVESFFKHLNEGQVDAAFLHVKDDVKWWVPGTLPFSGTKDKSQYMAIVGRIQSGFPKGLVFTVRNMVAESNQVAAEVESLGQHVNGKTYANKYHFLFTFQDQRFAEVKEYMDTLHLKELIS